MMAFVVAVWLWLLWRDVCDWRAAVRGRRRSPGEEVVAQ
jgi:hypothetical protein